MGIVKRVLFFLLLASPAFGQVQSISAFNAKAFAKATTSTDTSATIYIAENPWVAVQTTTTGSDSSKLYIAVDAQINGVWSNAVVRDTVPLGRPAGKTLASSKGQVENYFLRTSGNDVIWSSDRIRIRNTHASGSADSTSTLTYTQTVITRH